MRGNYLGQDRMDMQFAAKEISRLTSKPEEQDWRSAKKANQVPEGQQEGDGRVQPPEAAGESCGLVGH